MSTLSELRSELSDTLSHALSDIVEDRDLGEKLFCGVRDKGELRLCGERGEIGGNFVSGITASPFMSGPNISCSGFKKSKGFRNIGLLGLLGSGR